MGAFGEGHSNSQVSLEVVAGGRSQQQQRNGAKGGPLLEAVFPVLVLAFTVSPSPCGLRVKWLGRSWQRCWP